MAGAEQVRWLAREFPTVTMDFDERSAEEAAEATAGDDGGGARARCSVDLARWQDRHNDFGEFDARVDALDPACEVTLAIEGPPEAALRAAGEMLTRWQRLLGRRNPASSSALFDAALARLRSLHDGDKPLVRADWNHAVDTWQWSLRLDGGVGAAPQLAALLHDVERLESEADARVEHLAPDYAAFKRAHAGRGSRIAAALLEACGADPALRDRVVELVARHERPDADPDVRLLNDADALSFFSQNSAGYLDYFGPAKTREKIAYSLRRMRPAAAARIAAIRLREDVGRLLDEVRDGERNDPSGVPAAAPDRAGANP